METETETEYLEMEQNGNRNQIGRNGNETEMKTLNWLCK